MSDNLSSLSIIKRLHELDLFFVTTRTLADLFALTPTRIYQVAAQLTESELLVAAEYRTYLVLGLEP